MKRFKILLLLFFLATGFTLNAMSTSYGNNGNHNGFYTNAYNSRNNVPPIGVPLDGGLLTVLGVAGAAYFVARKKGKKLES